MARKLKLHQKTCDKFHEGTCRAWTEALQRVLYCPPERAQHAPPGACCHHPLFVVRERLAVMKQAGVKLKRYGAKLRDPAFVERLYSAFSAARKKRARASSQTKSIS